jgi:hypothetical protein
MLAIGSRFRFEGHKSTALFHAAKVVIVEQIRRYHLECTRTQSLVPTFTLSQPGTTRTPSPSFEGSKVGSKERNHPEGGDDRRGSLQEDKPGTHDYLLQAGQALIGLLVMGAWGPQDLVRQALTLQSLAASVARDNGLSGVEDRDAFPEAQEESEWHSWVRSESVKRTNLMIYCILQLMSTAYHLPPSILTSEINCDLPTPAEQWNAKTSCEWELCHQPNPGSTERSVQGSFELLFDVRPRRLANPYFSSLDNYILILALLQHIFLRQQTLSSSPKCLSPGDITEISRALVCWQTFWERSPDSAMDPASPHGPLAFNSTALLRLAWIRLYADLGPWRHLASREVNLIASAFNNGPCLIRGPGLIGPALQAAHALSIPVRMGIRFVSKARAISWSVQHSLSNLECAIFLSKWLEQLAVTALADPLDHEELRVVKMIRSLLLETELFDEDSLGPIDTSDVRSLKQQIRHLATGIARLWADIFRGTHVFEVVSIIGESLSIYADAMAAAHTSPGGPAISLSNLGFPG